MAAHDHAISRGFSVTWSVAIEEWFYLFFPAALLMTPRRHVWKLLLTVGLASAAARAGWHLANPTVGLTPYVMPQFRLDGLCAGGLVALAVRAPQALALVTARWSALRTLALALVIPVPLVIAFIRPALASNMYIWGHLWLSIAFALLILVVVTAPQRFGVLASRPLRLAGRYSYSLYLFHPLFLSLFFVLAGRPELLETPGDVALMLGSLATTIIVCVLLYAFVEKAALRRGHEARYAPPPRTAGELVVPAVR